MKHSSKIVLLLMLAATMLPFSSVRAQAPTPPAKPKTETPIEMTVTPAFDGVFKYGEWLPLTVELTNPGPDLEAEVQVRVPRANGGVTFAEPVALPSGAHKRLTLYILPNNYTHSLDVELVSGGEAVVTRKAAMRPMMNVNIIIGLVTNERGALSLLNGVQYPNNMRPVQVVDVDLDQLPEQIEGLRSFDVLVFNNIDTSKVTPAQAASLRAWVQSGGRLVLGGGAGADVTLAGFPAELLPVKVEGRRSLTADDLQPLVKYTEGMKILAGGEFIANQVALTEAVNLAGTGDQALVSERAIGKGFVDFVALDLSAAPFEGWSSSQRFWEKLLRTSENLFNQPTDISQRSMRANTMVNALTMIPSMELPSVKWLAIILGVYIFIVGPLNYWLLKRKNRLHWAWFTIPGITILFSAAAFGGGYLLKGNDLLIHKIGVLEVQPGGSALVSSYMGLFSPSQKSYQIEIPAGSLLSPIMDEGMPYNMGGPGSEITIQQGKPSVLSGLAVNQWSMQSFMTEETIPDYGRISGDLKMENKKLVGKVRNDLKVPLKDVTLIIRNQYQFLGDLKPGEEAKVDLDPTPNLTMRGMPVYYMMYDNVNAANPELSASERALIDLKRSVFSPLFDTQMMFKLSSSVGSGGGGGGGAGGETQIAGQEVLLLGWVDQLPPDIEVAGEKATVQTLGLVYDYVGYKMPTEGKISFPPGLLTGKVIKSTAGMCGPMDSVSLYFDRNTEATVEYMLPDPAQYDYGQIDLRLEADQPLGQALPKVSLYDWDAKKWVRFPKVAIGTNTIETPRRFIGSDGAVRLKFEQNPDTQMGGCVFMEMGFGAEGKGGAQ